MTAKSATLKRVRDQESTLGAHRTQAKTITIRLHIHIASRVFNERVSDSPLAVVEDTVQLHVISKPSHPSKCSIARTLRQRTFDDDEAPACMAGSQGFHDEKEGAGEPEAYS